MAAIAILAVVTTGAQLARQLTSHPDTPRFETPAAPDRCVSIPGAGSPLQVDLDGDGCAVEVSLTEGVLRTPSAAYAFGEPGDVLLAGDWDGDGRVGIGLYRPSTGAVLLIDEPGPGATSRTAERLGRFGTAHVVTTTGGDHVELADP